MLVLMGVLLLATSALAKADVLKKKTLMLRDGASNTIMILCIDKHKFIQTIIYSPNGNVSVSLIQMLEPTKQHYQLTRNYITSRCSLTGPTAPCTFRTD
jgi:hypothetical protein